MSLRFKVLLFVIVVSMSFVAASWLVQRAIMQPEFARLEGREADGDLQRVREALRRDLDALSRSANDYAAWDDTYAYVRKPNAQFEGANLVVETYANFNLDLLAILRTDGSLVWGKARSAEGGHLIDAPEVIALLSRRQRSILPVLRPDSRNAGFLMTERGTLLLGAAAITTTDNTGKVQGTLVMGRFLSDTVVSELRARTGIALALHRLDAVPADERQAMAHVPGPGDVWRDDADPEVLHTYALLPDLENKPGLLLRIDLPRVVSIGARQATTLGTLTSLAAGVLMSLVTWLVLTRMIVDPLTRVTGHAVRVGTEGRLHARLGLRGRDEIAVLAREFDQMVGRLEESQRKLVDVAHDAGRSEIAQDVLHNVGNVLNSANVSAGLVSQTLARSEVQSMGLAVQLMEEHREDLGQFLTQDERGRHLPAFLNELASQLATENATLRKEMATVSASLDHISEIVRAQNEHAGAKPLLELTEPARVVDQALALTAESFQRERIRVERRGEVPGPVLLDRHRILQVLANLLANAKHAVSATGGENPCVTITLDRIAGEQGDRLYFRVSDNGVGIPHENLDRIFASGFSTRPGGRGRGLHSAANQAREMGGDLGVASEGSGHGATFTLAVPARQAQETE